ncbi:P-loop NTPase [Aeromonas caviae]
MWNNHMFLCGNIPHNKLLGFKLPQQHNHKKEIKLRWLHCSDFHIGKDRTAQERLTTRIVDHVAEQVSNGFVPDLVFITGDVANSANKKEYSSFRKDFLKPLREALGGDSWDGRILAVPGNHDVDRSKNNNFDRRAPLAAKSRFFDPDKQGKVDRDILSPRFKAYRQGAVADISGDWISNNAGAFSEELVIRGINVGVVGINTAWLSKDEKDRHQLTPGFQLVDAALERVKDCQVCFVLGHHPLNWLDEDSTPRLKALFGQHGVIYLHGHMHQADGSREDGAGNEFLVFQAGAAFQARDGEPWENGLLWGEISISDKCALLSPRFWNPNNLDWPIKTGRFPENRRKTGTDWWTYPLPNHRNGGATGVTKPWQAPAGWEVLNKEKLISLQREISTEEAERFFDGAEADWALAQSPKIGRRTQVSGLASHFIDYQSQERPLVVHLTGPGGEGKSMILRQTLVAILEQNDGHRILWHTEDATTFPPESIPNLPEGPWIIATDAADMSAASIHGSLKALKQARRTDIKFLLCSRDSDWRASGAEQLYWNQHSDYRVQMISGLSEEDAGLIAASWSAFEGDNTRSGGTIHEQGQALFEATRKEAAISEGALLGGILAIRYGVGLRGHIANLLDRLRTYPLESGGSLYEAFAYIALMHAENLDFLSRPVLAKVLNCDPKELGRQVIVPLAKEAAANGGTILLTRHRRIADMAISIIHEDYGEDVTTRFVDLAKAAKNARRDYGFVPELHRWDFELPEHLIGKEPEASVRIAQALLAEDPENLKLTVNAARIYREAGDPENGIDLLRCFSGKPGRGFWYEWGTCAGNTGDASSSAVLAAFELTDQVLLSPDIKSSTVVLSGLGRAFSDLRRQFGDSRFAMAGSSSAWLGLKLPYDAKASRFYQIHKNEADAQGLSAPKDLHDALSQLKEGILAAWEVSAIQHELLEIICSPDAYSFNKLEGLFSRLEPK